MINQLIINGKKSYDDFNVYIADRNISSPKKKVIKESVPFSNVVYDFSKMDGEIYWEERILQYSFDIAELSTKEMEETKTKLLNWLLNVHDTDIYDPYIGDYHFHGSYDSDTWIENFEAGTITVSFSVYPYKISNSDANVIKEIGVSHNGVVGKKAIGLKIEGKTDQTNLFSSGWEQGQINTEGDLHNSTLNVRTKDFIKVFPNYTYTITRSVTTSYMAFRFYDENYNYLGYQITDGFVETNKTDNRMSAGHSNMTLKILNSDIKYMKISENSNDLNTIYTMTTDGVPNAEHPVEMQDFNCSNMIVNDEEVPFELILRSLPDGVCDIYKNGTITRNIGVITFDGSESWEVNPNYKTTYKINKPSDCKSSSSLYCNRYLNVSLNTNDEAIFCGEWFNVKDTTFTTVEEFKTWLSENPITFYYQLNTPIIETLEMPTISANSVISFDSVLQPAFEVYYNDAKTITINNNSSHRIAPTITSTGSFTISVNGVSYAIGEGTYNGKFYLEEGINELKITGYGSITFSYVEELF